MSPGGKVSTLCLYENPWAAVVDYLDYLQIDHIFGLPSDDLVLLTALKEKPSTRMILCKDQRNAVFMGIGYAMHTKQPGVCIVGKGPALTNALTGLLEAQSQGSSLILIATGTRVDRVGTKAFQELDQLSVVRPLVKWAYRVDHPDRLCWAMEKAACLAVNGTPGPVYIEIAEQLLDKKIPRKKPWEALAVNRFLPEKALISQTFQRIQSCRRPLLLLGGGMRNSMSKRAVVSFAEQWGAATFVTASGRGAFPEDHPLFCGLSGLYTNESMVPLWEKTDLVAVLGSRLEETATFGWERIDPKTTFIQVNIEADDWSLEYPGFRMTGDGGLVVETWLQALGDDAIAPRSDWVETIQACRTDMFRKVKRRLEQFAVKPSIHVAEVLQAVDRIAAEDRILVQENGLQDMWSYFYPYYSCGTVGHSVVPSDQTSLGFGAAAAAGVRLAATDQPVIAWVGDGAFRLFQSDLITVLENQIPLVYMVLKNGGYGWLQHQWNQHHDQSRGHFGYSFISAPAEALEWAATHPQLVHLTLSEKAQLERVVKEACLLQSRGKTVVVEIAVQLHDIPPGMETVAGDFPGKEDVSIGD